MKKKAKMPSSDKRVRRLAWDASLLGFALMLSFVEAILPLAAWLPLPGFKLGLSNMGVLLAAYALSLRDAAAVSVGKVFLTALLFGNGLSLFFSASGAFFVLVALLLLRRTGRFSFLGISVLCAVSHNGGQLAAALLWMDSTAPLSYAPVLLLASLVTGSLTGLLLNGLWNILQGKMPAFQA